METLHTVSARRRQLAGELFALYADIGWSAPTSVEYAPLERLAGYVADARREWNRRCA